MRYEKPPVPTRAERAEALTHMAQAMTSLCVMAAGARTVDELDTLDSITIGTFQTLSKLQFPRLIVVDAMRPAVAALEKRAETLGVAWISALHWSRWVEPVLGH